MFTLITVVKYLFTFMRISGQYLYGIIEKITYILIAWNFKQKGIISQPKTYVKNESTLHLLDCLSHCLTLQ